MANLDLTIATGNDDGNSGTGSGYSTGSSMQMGGYYGTAQAWFRFQLNVPQGSTINSATLTGNRISSAGTADLRFKCELALNPTYPTSSSDFDARTKTTAYTDASYSGTGAWTSANFKTSVQEVVDQASWVANNYIIVYVLDNNSNATHGGFENRIQINAYESGSPNWPHFLVDYSAAAILGTSALTASATMATAATRTQQGTAALTASGTMATAATRTQQGTAALTASATMATSGNLDASAVAAMTASATMTSEATREQQGTAALTASGTMATSGNLDASASSAMTASGVMTSEATRTQFGTIDLTATAIMVSAGDIVTEQFGEAALTATATMTTSATSEQLATIDLTASAVMVSAGDRSIEGTAALTATGTMTTAATSEQLATVAMTASASMATTAINEQLATVAMTASAVMTCAGVLDNSCNDTEITYDFTDGYAGDNEEQTFDFTAWDGVGGSAYLNINGYFPSAVTWDGVDFADLITSMAAAFDWVLGSTHYTLTSDEPTFTITIEFINAYAATNMTEVSVSSGDAIVIDTLVEGGTGASYATITFTFNPAPIRGVFTLDSYVNSYASVFYISDFGVYSDAAPSTGSATLTRTTYGSIGAYSPTISDSTLSAGCAWSGTAALNATGVMTTTARATARAAAALTASGTFTAEAMKVLNGAAAMTASATMETAAISDQNAAADLTATGVMTTTAISEQLATSNLTATAVMVTEGWRVWYGELNLTASAMMETTGLYFAAGVVNLTAPAVMTTNAISIQHAATALTATATMATVAVKEKLGTADLTATAGMTVDAISNQLGTIALTAPASMATSATSEQLAAATLTGSAVMATSAAKVLNGSAAMTATAVLSSAALRTAYGSAAMTASASMATEGSKSRPGAVAMTVSATMATAGMNEKFAAVAMTVSGSMATTAKTTQRARASMTSSATMATASQKTANATVAFAASAEMNLIGQALNQALCNMAAAASMQTTALKTSYGAADLTVSGSMATTGRDNRTYFGEADLSISGSMATSANRNRPGRTNFTANASLNCSPIGTFNAEADLICSAIAQITGHLNAVGSVNFTATATLKAAFQQHICQAVRQHLVNQNAISDLVGSYIFPSTRFDDLNIDDLNVIGYSLLDYQHEHTLSGAAGVAWATIEFEVISKTHLEGIEIANALKDELIGYQGFMQSREIFSVILDNQSEEYELVETGSGHYAYSQVLTFRILHVETVPQLLLPFDLSSPEVEKSLYSYLKNHTGLNAIGDRLYPSYRPQKTVLPAIVYHRTSSGEEQALEGGSIAIAAPSFRFEILAESYDTCLEISESMRQIMDGVSGQIGETEALYIWLQNEEDAVEMQGKGKRTAYYSMKQDYVIGHKN